MFAILFEQLSPLQVGAQSQASWRAALRPVRILEGSYADIWRKAKSELKAPVLEFYATRPSKEVYDDYTALFTRGVAGRLLRDPDARAVLLTTQEGRASVAYH